MPEKLIYIASPLGFFEAGRYFLEHKLLPLVSSSGYGYIDPWALVPAEMINKVQQMPYGLERKAAYTDLNKHIGTQNALSIDKCIGILAVLDGVDVDSGTAAEIGYCVGKSKPVLGYRSDFRLAADNEGSIVNLQVEFFIKMNNGIIVNTLEEVNKNLPLVFR